MVLVEGAVMQVTIRARNLTKQRGDVTSSARTDGDRNLDTEGAAGADLNRGGVATGSAMTPATTTMAARSRKTMTAASTVEEKVISLEIVGMLTIIMIETSVGDVPSATRRRKKSVPSRGA